MQCIEHLPAVIAWERSCVREIKELRATVHLSEIIEGNRQS